jgi:hypothetical protein
MLGSYSVIVSATVLIVYWQSATSFASYAAKLVRRRRVVKKDLSRGRRKAATTNAQAASPGRSRSSSIVSSAPSMAQSASSTASGSPVSGDFDAGLIDPEEARAK